MGEAHKPSDSLQNTGAQGDMLLIQLLSFSHVRLIAGFKEAFNKNKCK
jgi:hypothetical protein